MAKFVRTDVHAALVEAGIAVYEAASQYQTAALCVMEYITLARESQSPSEFEEWATSEFGTGGTPKTDGYEEGEWPKSLRKSGHLALRGRVKGDVTDSCANRVNTFVGDVRAIVRKCIESPTFEFGESFRATYKAARAKGTGENVAGKADDSAKQPSDAVTVQGSTVAITAEQGRTWINMNIVDAIDTLRRAMLARKDVIRAATLDAIGKQLAEQAKADDDARIAADKAKVVAAVAKRKRKAAL